MKNILAVLTLACGALASGPAHAFPPTIFYGAGFFNAGEACADLGIAKGETFSLAADYSHFEVEKVSSSAENGFESFLKYAVPEDGAYVFHGDAGLQYTDEFLTHAWSGQDVFDFKLEPETGDLVIVHGSSQKTTTCHLTRVSGA